MSETFVLGLGSNLGSRWALLRAALDRIGALEGIRIEAVGRPRRSEALVLPGEPPGPPFLNGVARLRSQLEPEGLLDRLHVVEAELGRLRDRKWAARTMDLDLLTWSGAPRATERLSLPHAELEKRPFALAGVADLGDGGTDDPKAPFASAPRLKAVGATRSVSAEHDADALAWALSLGAPAGPFEPLEAPSPEAFVDGVNEREAAAVVVFELGHRVRGATSPGLAPSPPDRTLRTLGAGRCDVRLVE